MKKSNLKLAATRAAQTFATFVAVLSLVFLAPITAFAADAPTGSRASIPDGGTTATRAATGIDWLTGSLIVAVVILVVVIIAYAIIRTIKGNRAATANAIRAGQNAVVQIIDPNARMNDANAIIREVPVNRTSNPDGTVTFGSPGVNTGPAVVPPNPNTNPWR